MNELLFYIVVIFVTFVFWAFVMMMELSWKFLKRKRSDKELEKQLQKEEKE